MLIDNCLLLNKSYAMT